MRSNLQKQQSRRRTDYAVRYFAEVKLPDGRTEVIGESTDLDALEAFCLRHNSRYGFETVISCRNTGLEVYRLERVQLAVLKAGAE